MRRIGLIGGMSWESTAVYYRRLNEQVRDRMGGLNSADIVLRSVNFAEIERLQRAGDWDGAGRILAGMARDLRNAGAEIVLICTNTMHLLADEIQAAIDVPLLHIADVTANALRAGGARRPLLLATRYTMEQPFYRGRLRDRHGLDVSVPDTESRGIVHDVIFGELCRGVIRDESRRAFVGIIDRARAAGADSVILGCTEIGLLIGEEDAGLPTYDTTFIHADAALDFALGLSPAEAG